MSSEDAAPAQELSETPGPAADAVSAAPETAAAAEAMAHVTLQEGGAGEALPEAQGSEALVSAQDSGVSATSPKHQREGSPSTKTFRRIGTELVEMKTLSKDELEESADRLSKPKEVIRASTVRPKAVQLKYKFDKKLRGGKGGFSELLVPAKTSSKEEKQAFMVALAERCKEQKEKSLAALREKYLGPLNPNAKKVHKGEETDQHLAKLDRLYHGQGVTEK